MFVPHRKDASLYEVYRGCREKRLEDNCGPKELCPADS